MVALEAVVTREVALKGRQNGEMHLLRVIAEVVKELVQSIPFGFPVVDDEPVAGQFVERGALLIVKIEPLYRARLCICCVGIESVEKRSDVGRDDELRVGEHVHQEHVVASR